MAVSASASSHTENLVYPQPQIVHVIKVFTPLPVCMRKTVPLPTWDSFAMWNLILMEKSRKTNDHVCYSNFQNDRACVPCVHRQGRYCYSPMMGYLNSDHNP